MNEFEQFLYSFANLFISVKIQSYYCVFIKYKLGINALLAGPARFYFCKAS
jgi:hypothetical protein